MPNAIPSFHVIDAIIMAYRLGYVRFDEQKQALLQAACASTDTISFMNVLETYGISKNNKLYHEMGRLLSSITYYRKMNERALGLRHTGSSPTPFLNNTYVIFLTEPVLTKKQQDTFYKAYWYFVHNHKPVFLHKQKGPCIGIYATEPQDNESTINRFVDYIYRLEHHSTQKIRQPFQDFPTEIVLAILRRAFL